MFVVVASFVPVTLSRMRAHGSSGPGRGDAPASAGRKLDDSVGGASVPVPLLPVEPRLGKAIGAPLWPDRDEVARPGDRPALAVRVVTRERAALGDGRAL